MRAQRASESIASSLRSWRWWRQGTQHGGERPGAGAGTEAGSTPVRPGIPRHPLLPPLTTSACLCGAATCMQQLQQDVLHAQGEQLVARQPAVQLLLLCVMAHEVPQKILYGARPPHVAACWRACLLLSKKGSSFGGSSGDHSSSGSSVLNEWTRTTSTNRPSSCCHIYTYLPCCCGG